MFFSSYFKIREHWRLPAIHDDFILPSSKSNYNINVPTGLLIIIFCLFTYLVLYHLTNQILMWSHR